MTAICAHKAIPFPGSPAVQCPDCGAWVIHDEHGLTIIPPARAAEIADPKWRASHHASAVEHVTVTYRGSSVILYPVTNPADPAFGGSYEVRLQCEHEHETERAARDCGLTLAANEAARRNAQGEGAR